MTPVRVEAQRAALDSILASRTFDRSEQLKAILRYVCERTWQGQASALTEYTIGVDVLSKGANFSPQEDSVVRNRAYALRKKLDEYYESEGIREFIRISLPKGAYAPVFTEAEATPLAISPPPPSRRNWLGFGAVAAAGMAGGALIEHLRLNSKLRPEPTPALKAFWGPFFNHEDKAVLCVGTPPQSFLRTFPTSDVKVPGTYLAAKDLEAWLTQQRIERQGTHVLQVPTTNSPLWGDAAGAERVSRLLSSFGMETEVVAERLVALPVLRNRNVVFLATSEYSSAATRLLRDLPFGIAYDIPSGDHVPLRFDASGQVVERYPVKRTNGQLTEVYGLITRIVGEGDGEKPTLYFVLSGVSSAGILAAAEFATSPHHLAELSAKTPFNKQPLQILLKVRSDKTVPLSFEYFTHASGKRR